MWLRTNVALAVAIILAVAQMFASVAGGPQVGDTNAVANSSTSGLVRSVAAQDDDNDDDDNDDDEDNDDDDDNDGDDDNDDEDNDDSDNDEDNDDSDNDEDNDDEDNDDSDNDDDADNDDDSDNDGDDDNDDFEDEFDDELDNFDVDTSANDPFVPSSSGTTPAGTSFTTEAQLVTAGIDATLALQTDRIAVRVFSTMPAGITLNLRLVDPLTFPATPGIRAGDLIFQLEAIDSTGVVLTSLPAEFNLSVRYSNLDVTGLSDAAITMGHLDPFDSTWKTAAKLVTDPHGNYLGASEQRTGTYAVYVP